jgi:hypothetical protein
VAVDPAELLAGFVWVPNWSSTSCDLGVFVDQSTEPIAASDAKRGRRRRGWKRLERRCLVQCSVRPVGVEVRHVLGQHRRKLALVEDQHPIQQLAAYGADPAFGDCVRAGRLHRGAQDADGLAGEHGIENGGELAVAIPDEEPEPSRAVAEVHQEVAGLLGDPGSGRVCGDAQQVHAASGVLDDEQNIERCPGSVSAQKKSVARMPCAWARRNCRQLGPSRRGAGSMPARFRIDHTVLGASR